MKNLTTTEIENFLSERFTEVKKLKVFDTNKVKNSENLHVRNVSQMTYKGFTIVVGLYSTDKKLENWTRFVNIGPNYFFKF